MIAGDGSQFENSASSPELSLTCKLLCTAPVVHMRGVVILLYTLSLALCCSLYHRLAEERQELANRSLLVERETGDV